MIHDPLFIALRGPSVEILEEGIIPLTEAYPSAVWGAVNPKGVVEQHILSKVDKKFTYVYYSDPHLLEYYIEMINEFLVRPYNKVFISDFDTMKDMEKMRGKRVVAEPGSIVYSSYSKGKNPAIVDKFYNSLTAFLLTLISLGHREIVLFGADGGFEDPNARTYYKHVGSHLDGVAMSERKKTLREDADFMNEYFWDLVEPITSEGVSIINCCPQTNLTCFKRVDLKDLL